MHCYCNGFKCSVFRAGELVSITLELAARDVSPGEAIKSAKCFAFGARNLFGWFDSARAIECNLVIRGILPYGTVCSIG